MRQVCQITAVPLLLERPSQPGQKIGINWHPGINDRSSIFRDIAFILGFLSLLISIGCDSLGNLTSRNSLQAAANDYVMTGEFFRLQYPGAYVIAARKLGGGAMEVEVEHRRNRNTYIVKIVGLSQFDVPKSKELAEKVRQAGRTGWRDDGAEAAARIETGKIKAIGTFWVSHENWRTRSIGYLARNKDGRSKWFFVQHKNGGYYDLARILGGREAVE